jgi:hypothetical protein
MYPPRCHSGVTLCCDTPPTLDLTSAQHPRIDFDINHLRLSPLSTLPLQRLKTSSAYKIYAESTATTPTSASPRSAPVITSQNVHIQSLGLGTSSFRQAAPRPHTEGSRGLSCLQGTSHLPCLTSHTGTDTPRAGPRASSTTSPSRPAPRTPSTAPPTP